MDVTAICRAYVDCVVRMTDGEVAALGLKKGGDVPVGAAQMKELLDTYLPRGKMVAGGPAANSMAGVAALGGRAAFIGKVAHDVQGRAFARDFAARGVLFDCDAAREGSTASCLVCVHPDGQRSVFYHTGVADDITAADIERNRAVLAESKILYVGLIYRLEQFRAISGAVAHYASRARVATTLQSYGAGDSPLVARRILEADIILGNEEEYTGFMTDLEYETLESLAAAWPEKVFARTLGDKGAHVCAGTQSIPVPPHPVDDVRDATGAGDAWAAGFLYGLSSGKTLEDAAALASFSAAQILAEDGGRPTRSWNGAPLMTEVVHG